MRPRISFIRITRRQTSTNCLSSSLGANPVPKHCCCCSPSLAGGWLSLPGSFQMGHGWNILLWHVVLVCSLFFSTEINLLLPYFSPYGAFLKNALQKTAVEIFFLFSWQHVKCLTMSWTVLAIKLTEFQLDKKALLKKYRQNNRSSSCHSNRC